MSIMQAAPHHLLQQDDAVLVEAARIGMPAAHRWAFERLKQIAHGRHLANQRLAGHRRLGRDRLAALILCVSLSVELYIANNVRLKCDNCQHV